MIPSIFQLLPLIPGLPLAAAIVTAILGPKVLRGRSHWPTVIAFALSCAASLMLLFEVHHEAGQGGNAKTGYEKIVPIYTWADVNKAYSCPNDTSATLSTLPIASSTTLRNFRIEIALRADPLTAVMLAVVTFISTLVAIYSIGYMHGDPGYWRFFGYISLFVFSMTMLVTASNFLLLYVFWEAVGLCSYLLIGFWYEKPPAAAAGKKAFLVNRIGDFGFALGIFLIWTTFGTLDFHDTGALADGTAATVGVLGKIRLAGTGPIIGEGVATAICLLLMLGACGKSAQFPLHVWLPDAMEGPTPVSALIHAATMVTAGVYMVARCMPLFVASPLALHVVAILGGLTALLGAIIAITQTDLKRILAYSTISHLGYMFLAMGAGTVLGVTAGMFHLVTHAFFKALLFLAAGSVMHAMGGVIDIRRFGGLRQIMPVTCYTFLIGGLAMAGLFPLAGFYSKDAILLADAYKFSLFPLDHIYQILYWTAFGGIVLIALYTFRPFMLTFYGKEVVPQEAGSHAHESPAWMTLPLVILAIGAAGSGFILEQSDRLSNFLELTPSVAFLNHNALTAEPPAEMIEPLHRSIEMHSIILVIVGILLTLFLYSGSRRRLVDWLTKLMKLLGIYQLSFGKFFFDPLYQVLIVWPLELFAAICAWFDHWFIDGTVDAVGRVPQWVGASFRPLQGGLIQFYALAMILGVLVLLGALLL